LKSGPSLTKREAHHAIHEAAFTEAEEMTRLLRHAALADDHERALHLVGVLVEHWQTRTLRHAEAEEQGWYRDLARERPDLQPDIVQLTRDHDLLRKLLDEIEQIVAARGWVAGVVERFEAMLLVNAIHSRDEEQRLLGGERTRAALPHAGDANGETLGHASEGDGSPSIASANELPLAVAYPSLYEQGVERLSEHGIRPGDLRLTIQRVASGSGAAERVRLHATFGRDFVERLEMPLPDPSDRVAIERAFDTIAEACERTVRADYYAAMEITEPGAPGSRGDKGARFNITVLNQPKDLSS
jgi:hypothetical protein